MLWFFSLLFLSLSVAAAMLPRFGIFLTQIAAFIFTGASAILLLQILLGRV